MKKMLTLVAALVFGASLTAGSCSTGECHKKDCARPCAKPCKDECVKTCPVRTTQREYRDVMIKCPKTVTVFEEKPAKEYRDVVTTHYEAVEVPQDSVEKTEWVRPTCPSKKCGHCLECRGRRHNHNETIIVEPANDEVVVEKSSKKRARAEKSDKSMKNSKKMKNQ